MKGIADPTPTSRAKGIGLTVSAQICVIVPARRFSPQRRAP
jgi:hypothetical protein